MQMIVRTLMAMSALLLLLILIWPLMRRHVAAGARFAICVLVLVGLLVPVRFSMAVRLPERARQMRFVQGITAPPAAVAQALSAQAAAPGTESDSVSASPMAAPPVTPLQAAMTLWALGALAVLGIGVVRHARLLRHVRRHAVPGGEAGGMGVFYLDSRFSPFVIGWRRPRLILPVGYHLTELVLRHEQIHVRRGDALFRALLLAVRAMHWWNPLAWLFARIASEECELSCDALALRGAGETERQDYAWRVLEAAGSGVPATALTNGWGGGKRHMKQRLSSIVQPGRARKGHALVALALILVLCAGSVLAEPAASTGDDLDKLVVGYGTEFHRMSDMNYPSWTRLVDPGDASKGRELNPDVKLIEGWEAKLVEAYQYYFDDVEGRAGWVRATGVIAVPVVGNSDLTEYRFQEALKAGVDRGASDYMAIREEIFKVFPDYLLELYLRAPEGLVGSSWNWSDEIKRITEVDTSGVDICTQLKQQALENELGLKLVQDPREITMVPTFDETTQLIKDYAGQNVIVEFANGSLWWFYDDASIGRREAARKKGGERAQLRVTFKLIGLTKLGLEDALQRASKVLQSVFRDQEVPKAKMKGELFPALCQEFGIDESEAENCFDLFIYG